MILGAFKLLLQMQAGDRPPVPPINEPTEVGEKIQDIRDVTLFY